MSISAGQPQDPYIHAMWGMHELNTLLTDFQREVNTEFGPDSTQGSSWWAGRGAEIPAKLQEITAKADAVMQEVQATINSTQDPSKIAQLKSSFHQITNQMATSRDELATITPNFNQANWPTTRWSFSKATQKLNTTLSSQVMRTDSIFRACLGNAPVNAVPAPKPFTQGVVDALEALREISYKPISEVSVDLITQWADAHGSSITEEVCRTMPKNLMIQFASLLADIKKRAAPAGEILLGRYEAILSFEAKQYLQVLLNNFGTVRARDNIKKIFPDKQSQFCAIAHYVNIYKENLAGLLEGNLYTREDLLQLAPHLRYVDLNGIDESGKPDFLVKLIKKCSNLNFLTIHNDEIETLPPLPFCRDLSCGRCLKLRELPALPLCNRLVCNDCRELQTLIELPLCRVLYCAHCTALQTLPELPRCTILDCSNCPSLRSISTALPSCRRCDFTGCPLLLTMPEVPYTAQVASDTTTQGSEFTKLEVDIDQLAQDPKSFLTTLGSQYLLQGKPFPNVYYFSHGELSPAIDVGGVRRDFVSRLFELLFKADGTGTLPVSRDRDAGVWPTAPISDSTTDNSQLATCYETIGRLFALCYADACRLKTGQVFDPELFQVLKVIARPGLSLEETLIHSLLVLKRLPETVAELAAEEAPGEAIGQTFDNATLMNATHLLSQDADEIPTTPADFSQAATRAALRQELFDEARADARIRVAYLIASEMEKALGDAAWAQFCKESADVSQKKIEGELSAEALKKKLQWKPERHVAAEKMQRTKQFLEHWIDGNKDNPDQLRRFVRAVTSNNTLGTADLVIQLFNRGAAAVPSTHTCFFTLELSADYTSQEQFNERLSWLVGQSDEGFQAA